MTEWVKEKFHHLLPFLIFMVLYMIWFEILEHITRTNSMLISCTLDQYIPFLEGFIIPYDSWFFFLAFGLLLLLIQDPHAYDQAVTFLMTGMIVFLLVSTFLPNRLDLRPSVMPRDNIFIRMVASLWAIDPAENVWPSIHVYDTIALATAMIASHASWMKKARMRLLIIVWAALIILSTLFIRQHSLIDHLTAYIMFGIMALLIYRFGLVYRFVKTPSKQQ